MAPHARAAVDTARPVRLALDAMSGDRGAGVVVAAARAIVERYPHVTLDLVGDRAAIEALLGASHERLVVVHADQVVEMDEPPADALRRKKQSSMRLAVDRVKAGEADACLSAGNTGALMATAKFVLKTVSNIERPAIMAELPAIDGSVHVLVTGGLYLFLYRTRPGRAALPVRRHGQYRLRRPVRAQVATGGPAQHR